MTGAGPTLALDPSQLCAGAAPSDMSAAPREPGPAAVAFPAAGPERPREASHPDAGPTVLILHLDRAMAEALLHLGDFHADDEQQWVPYDTAALERIRDLTQREEPNGAAASDQPDLIERVFGGPLQRGPVQDESGALDPLDAEAMRAVESGLAHSGGPIARVLP